MAVAAQNLRKEAAQKDLTISQQSEKIEQLESTLTTLQSEHKELTTQLHTHKRIEAMY